MMPLVSGDLLREVCNTCDAVRDAADACSLLAVRNTDYSQSEAGGFLT